MCVAKVKKTHTKSDSPWKSHFLSRGYIVFITLPLETDIIFGQDHSMTISNTPIPINFNDKKSKHLPRQNKLHNETMELDII